MNRLRLIFFACWISCMASAQSPTPPPYTLTNETATGVCLPIVYWQLMPDASGKTTLQEALHAKDFTNSSRRVNYRVRSYWIRFSLFNTMQEDARIALPETAGYAQLYYTTDESDWHTAETGSNVAWSGRQGIRQVPAFTITIPSGETLTVYKKITWDFVAAQPDTMAVYLSSADKLLQHYANDETHLMTAIQNAFLIGLLVLSIIINFYFFLVVREKEFLLFCLFAGLFCLISLSSLDGVFFREHPRMQRYIYIFSRAVIQFALIQFVRVFLKTRDRFPRWDKYLAATNYCIVAGLLFAFFSSALSRTNLGHISHLTENAIYLVYGISLLITLLLYAGHHDRMTRLLVIALTPLVLLSVITYAPAILLGLYYPRFTAPDISGYTSPFNRVAFFILILSYLWMMVFFTQVLFLRFSKIRRELEQQKALDHLKTRFFTNISHEFRTPLTLIKGPVEDFLRDHDMEKFKAVMPEMYRNSNRLLQLINQLLDLSRINAGSYEINTAREDIIPFIKQIVHTFSSLAHRKNIRLETDVEPRLRDELRNETISFYFDGDVIEKIVTNLLSNAFKFTPGEGNITVSVGLSEQEKDSLELKVEDDGAGIAPNELPHIFERFYQAENAGGIQHEGTGIGLSLVKELVQLHGGKISVKSTVNKGTIFSCHLPLNKKHVTGSPSGNNGTVKVSTGIIDESSTDEGHETAAANGEPVILLVEDHQDVRKYIREKLADNYKVVEAKNGAEGLAVAKEQMPDLVISDVMMPEMDGFELCRLLKTDNLTCHIPVILLTARAEESDKLSGLETGADAYLVKPFNARELRIRVNNLITIRNKMRARFSHRLLVRPSEIAVTSRDRLFIRQVLDVTEQHLDDESFSVEQLGREVNMSTSQINRKLKALINQSAQQLIRSLRMQQALELLKNKAGNVSEISYQVGFSDPGYFARVFKSYFGYPPSDVKYEE